jgi:hypothetical protein
VAADGVRQLLGQFLAGPDAPPTHVLIADPSYRATYDDLDAAFRALRAGAELVATQVNQIAVRDDGEHLDTGGWMRLLEYATGQTARVLGKPSPEFFTAPLEALGRGPDTALVVGDDLAADIGVDGRSGRPRCWSAAARGPPPAGRRRRAGRGRRQRRRPARIAPTVSVPIASPEGSRRAAGSSTSRRRPRRS